ncbi:MAG: hypothetical protein HGB01_01915 [Chlorobiaceae bacterium]|nr:hypothetical protein [Chlorobiaceae bacterium]
MIQRILTAEIEQQLHQACMDLEPAKSFIVYPGNDRYRISERLEAIPLRDLAIELRSGSLA